MERSRNGKMRLRLITDDDQNNNHKGPSDMPKVKDQYCDHAQEVSKVSYRTILTYDLLLYSSCHFIIEDLVLLCDVLKTVDDTTLTEITTKRFSIFSEILS